MKFGIRYFMNKHCFNVYHKWHSAIGKGWGITQRRTSLWNPFTKKAFKGCQFWDLLFMEDPLEKLNNKICSSYKQKNFLVFYSFVHYKKYYEFQLPSSQLLQADLSIVSTFDLKNWKENRQRAVLCFNWLCFFRWSSCRNSHFSGLHQLSCGFCEF